MAYSIDPISANCYPGTAVLVNKFDIHDETILNEVEGTLTAAKSAQCLSAPEKETFDFEHYKISAQHRRNRWIIGIKSYKEKSNYLNNSV